MKPRLALTMRVTHSKEYIEVRDTISQDWIRKIVNWNAEPFLVPNVLRNPVEYFADFHPDLLILTGGGDVGEPKERDQTERQLFDFAQDSNIPVLGVCRGMQVINTLLGGSMISINGHAGRKHSIQTDLHWPQIYGDATVVNSYHNLGIVEPGLANELTATAYDYEDHIEAFQHVERPIAGVMWHPERPDAPKGDNALIKYLLGTVKAKGMVK